MFRVIAIALVAAFSLLGLMGSDPNAAYRQAGLVATGPGAGISAAIAPMPGARFVLRAASALKSEPKRSAAELAELRRGTPVLVLSSAPDGFARVRDHAGRMGYVPTLALTAAP